MYINAAAALYIMDKVSTISEGINFGRSLVNDGKASEKLEQFVKIHGDINRLEALKKQIL